MEERRVGALTFHLDWSQPLYEQIMQQMRQAIAKGELGPGEKIPSVREMAQSLRVNPNTVSHAYQQLERDGLTETRRGQGTFITTSAATIQRFRQDMAQRLTREFLQQMFAYGLSWPDIVQLLEAAQSMADGSPDGTQARDAPRNDAPAVSPSAAPPAAAVPACEEPSPKPRRGGHEHE
ncbi:MAG: GntR family transcriptional regulator [Alicyclobacillus sp.]|nr:GntR family transcriptional regulator [Alicyclobacillus sp.]